jgi:small subunit ribosomal protein S9
MAEKKGAKTVKAKTAKIKEVVAPVVELEETPIEEELVEEEFNQDETAEFSGSYIKAVGRRKQSVAKVRLYEGGRGIIMVNGMRANKYFSGEGANIIAQPLKVTGHARDFNFSVLVQGGGKQGQVGAARLGISRVIFAFDPNTKEALKVNGFLTRDQRQVERKKPGLRKARKAPQWSKR